LAAREAHNLEVPGSNPGPATKRVFDIYRSNIVLVEEPENRDRFHPLSEGFKISYRVPKTLVHS
jgi:hypothetical protein